ncbi:unnamed protein product, partial [Prunus brigantina]
CFVLPSSSSLSQNPHPERANIISHPWNTSISSHIPQSLPIFSSPLQSLMKLLSSCRKLAQATPFLFLISYYLPSTNSPKNSLFPLLRASVSHRKPKPSLSHANLVNAQLPCHKFLMPSHNIYM